MNDCIRQWKFFKFAAFAQGKACAVGTDVILNITVCFCGRFGCRNLLFHLCVLCKICFGKYVGKRTAGNKRVHAGFVICQEHHDRIFFGCAGERAVLDADRNLAVFVQLRVCDRKRDGALHVGVAGNFHFDIVLCRVLRNSDTTACGSRAVAVGNKTVGAVAGDFAAGHIQIAGTHFDAGAGRSIISCRNSAALNIDSCITVERNTDAGTGDGRAFIDIDDTIAIQDITGNKEIIQKTAVDIDLCAISNFSIGCRPKNESEV